MIQPDDFDRSAVLRAMTAGLGDAPRGPRFDVWAAAGAEAEALGYFDRQERLPPEVAERFVSAQDAVQAAANADDKAFDLDPESAPFMASPRHQLYAALRCLGLRKAVEAGDGWAVVEAMSVCASHALPVPGWLASQFVSRYQRIAVGDAKSWDDPDVFGSPVQKGTNIAGVRAMQQTAPKAHRAALRLLAADPSRPIDKGFYEAVGDACGVGATQAEKLVSQYVEDGQGTWAPPSALKPYLQTGLQLGEALSRWGDDQLLHRWRAAGGSDEQFREVFGNQGESPEGKTALQTSSGN